MGRKPWLKLPSKLDKFIIRSGSKFSKTQCYKHFDHRWPGTFGLRKFLQTFPSKHFSLSISRIIVEIEPSQPSFRSFSLLNTRNLRHFSAFTKTRCWIEPHFHPRDSAHSTISSNVSERTTNFNLVSQGEFLKTWNTRICFVAFCWLTSLLVYGLRTMSQ